MEASLYFSIPEICVGSISDDDQGNGSRPIFLLCRKSEHCDFINNYIIHGNEIIANLNIDRAGTLGIFLEVSNPTGFIITREDCRLIEEISMADHPVILPVNCLLTSIVIGSDFELEPELAQSVIESRRNTGIFSVTFGYRRSDTDTAYTSLNPIFIEFQEYTTMPNDEFAQKMVS